MPARLTQIASFSSGIAAQLARARLEAAGIPSFLTNELGSIAGGGVGLQVSESDVARARELLAGLRSLLLMVLPLPAEWFSGGRTRCGNCGFAQPAD